MGLTEIAAAIGMSKSSVHQLLATLQQRGFVRRIADQGYSIGIKAWEVGSVAAPMGLARIAEPHMMQLVQEISDGVSLGVLDGCEMVCIQLVESPRAVRVHNNIGDRTPAHCVSSGRAYFSATSDDVVSRLLPESLPKFTETTLGSRDELLAELKRIRGRGYAFCRGAWREEVGGASVPVIGSDGRVVAALCVAAPAFCTTRDWVARVVPALKSTAMLIEQDLRCLGGTIPAATLEHEKEIAHQS